MATDIVDPLAALAEFTRPEAPVALYDINIGDSAAELFLQGGWTTGLGGYLGFDSQGNTGISVDLPGFSQKPWYNEVDFLLSLWIDRHFFFEIKLGNGIRLDESTVIPELQMSSFSMGYANAAGPGLNRVQVANTGIGVPYFPYLGFGAASEGVPGILSEWSGPWSRHWAMLRLVNRSTVVQNFRGTAPEYRQSVLAQDFLRGQFFQLPYERLTAIRVWKENASGLLAGDGHRYQALGSRDLLYLDLEKGRVGLRSAAAGRVLIEARTGPGSLPVAVPALDRLDGLDPADSVLFGQTGFTERVLAPLKNRFLAGNGTSVERDAAGQAGLMVEIEDTKAWLVHEPGRFSLFEDSSWYAKPQGIEPVAVELADGSTNLEVAPLGDFLHLGANAGVGLLARYPLLSSGTPEFARIYLPGESVGTGSRLNWYGLGVSTGGLVLESDPVVESIAVTRNGRPEKGFSWNADKKAIVFVTPIQKNEEISVSYDVVSQTSGSRSLQFAQGNRFEFAPWFPLTAALGLDWPLATANNASTGLGHTTSVGHLVAGTDFRMEPPQTGLAIDGGGTARMDLPGVAGGTILQDFSGGTMLLAPAVSNLLPSNPVIWRQTFGLGLESRGRLLFRDYRSTGGTWIPWDSTVPVADDYATGHATGPYLAAAASGDSFSGTVAVAEMHFDASQQWVSWEMRLNPEQRSALARTGSLSWQFRGKGLTGNLRVWAEAGQLAEDIDGSGENRTNAAGQVGLPFHDAGLDIMLVAASAWQNKSGGILSKDANGNGWLDGEASPCVLSADRQYGSGTLLAAGDATWHSVRLVLSAEDRVRLQDATAIRMIVRKEVSDAELDGSLIWADLRVDQSGMTLENMTSSMAASVHTGSSLAVHQDLAAAFPQSTQTADPPAYAEARWSGSGPGSFELLQRVEPILFSRFNVMRFALRRDESAGAAVDFSLHLADDFGSYDSPGIKLDSLPPGQWCKASLDFRTARLEVRDSGGVLLATADCRITGLPRSYAAVRLRLESAGGASGRLLLDNFIVEDGVPGFSANGRLGVVWAFPGTILSTQGFPWLANLRIKQNFEAGIAAETVQHQGFSDKAGTAISWSADAGATLAALDIEGGIQLAADGAGYGGMFNYGLALPSGLSTPLVLKDGFATSFGNSTPYLSKSSGLDLSIPDIAELSASAAAARSSVSLAQDWKAGLGLFPGQAFSCGSDLSLSQVTRQAAMSPDWNNQPLIDRIGTGYAWYLPDTGGGQHTKRGNALNNKLQVKLAPFRLEMNQSLSGSFNPAAAQPHRTDLDLRTVFGLGGEEAGWAAELAYQRHSSLSDSWQGTNLGDDIQRSWHDVGEVPSTWAIWPFWEFFDPAPGFAAEGLAWTKASTMPRVSLTLVRPLGTDPWGQLVPKRLETSLARLVNLNGGVVDDGLLWYGKTNWLLLNLFGRNAAVPVFAFYGSDQIEAGFSTGLWQQDGVLKSWQLQADLVLSLFALSPLGATIPGMSPPVRSQGRDRFLKIMGADQAALKVSWYHLEGETSRDAGLVGLDWSWSLDVPEIKLDFLTVQPDGPVYLQNVASLAFSATSRSANPASDASALLQYYPFSSDGEFMAAAGLAFSVFHRSVLVLPDLAYVSLILGYGLQSLADTFSLKHAIQCGIEARVVF